MYIYENIYVKRCLGRCLIVFCRCRWRHCCCARRRRRCCGCSGCHCGCCCRRSRCNGCGSCATACNGAQTWERWFPFGWYYWLSWYGWRCSACSGRRYGNGWHSNGHRMWMRWCCRLIQRCSSSKCSVLAARCTLYGRCRLHLGRRWRRWSNANRTSRNAANSCSCSWTDWSIWSSGHSAVIVIDGSQRWWRYHRCSRGTRWNGGNANDSGSAAYVLTRYNGPCDSGLWPRHWHAGHCSSWLHDFRNINHRRGTSLLWKTVKKQLISICEMPKRWIKSKLKKQSLAPQSVEEQCK